MPFLMNKKLKRWKSHNLPKGTYLTTYLSHCTVSEYGKKIILATSLNRKLCDTQFYPKKPVFPYAVMNNMLPTHLTLARVCCFISYHVAMANYHKLSNKCDVLSN